MFFGIIYVKFKKLCKLLFFPIMTKFGITNFN